MSLHLSTASSNFSYWSWVLTGCVVKWNESWDRRATMQHSYWPFGKVKSMMNLCAMLMNAAYNLKPPVNFFHLDKPTSSMPPQSACTEDNKITFDESTLTNLKTKRLKVVTNGTQPNKLFWYTSGQIGYSLSLRAVSPPCHYARKLHCYNGIRSKHWKIEVGEIWYIQKLNWTQDY